MKILPIDLALRDLRLEWQAASCFVAALVGMLAPLLILLALKNGVVGTMVERLVEDPSNREIISVGAANYDQTFFRDMALHPDVGFVVPATRRINAAANAVRNPVNRNLERAVPLIPSAQGDPLIEGTSVAPDQVWVSMAVSLALEVQAGDQIEMLIGREIDGDRETARKTFTVLGVVSEQLYRRQAIFLAVPDLVAIENFRDDASIQVETFGAARPVPVHYASFRMYAADLQGLRGLIADLKRRGIQVRARAENATLLLSFRDNLNVLYSAIAGVAIVGFWASMAANLRGMVERQRVTFSLFRMLGMTPTQSAWIPLIQSIMLIAGGVLVTVLVVVPALLVINAMFQSPATDAVARLGWRDIAATIALGLFTAGSAAIWAMKAVRDVKTQEVLRNG